MGHVRGSWRHRGDFSQEIPARAFHRKEEMGAANCAGGSRERLPEFTSHTGGFLLDWEQIALKILYHRALASFESLQA
jgi:hypothetical protein